MRSPPARDSPTTRSFRPSARTSRSRAHSCRRKTTRSGTRFTRSYASRRDRVSRSGVPDHDFQILGGSLATLFLEIVHVRREERSQKAIRRDLERRQLLLGGRVGIEGNHRALIELVEGVRRVAIEQPYVSRLAEVPRQPREIAVGIRDQGRDQGTVLEVLAEGKHELVALEIGEKRLERGAWPTQEGLDRRVVILAPAPCMDEGEGHPGRESA